MSHGPKINVADGGHSLLQTEISFLLNENDAELEERNLPRTMGYFSGTMLCVGMMIGSGIFSTPAIILGEVGSVGMTFIIFVIGAVVSLCGVWAYCELGCMRPYSGGEKEYLDYCFPHPKALLAFLFTQCMVWLVRPGNCAADAVAFGEYMLYAFVGTKHDLEEAGNSDLLENYDWYVRALGVGCILFITLVHGYTPKFGIYLQDALTVIKTVVLLFVVIVGIVAATGLTTLPRADNFSNFFINTSSDATAYTSALFSAFFAFDGWNNLNYALDELIDPVVNLPRSALTAIGVTSFLYLSATLSYFVVIPTVAVDTHATVLAAQFFTLCFGETIGKKVIPFFIGLSAFGSVMCMVFGGSRVVFAAAREGYFPYGHFLGIANKQDGPIGALLFNMVMTLVLMLAPPPGNAYKFLIDLAGYPEWIFYGISVVGLLYLRFREPHTIRPFKSYWITNMIFIAVCVFLTVVPFIPPQNASDANYPYWLYPTIGLVFIILLIPLWYLQIVTNKGMEKSIKFHEAVKRKARLEDSHQSFNGTLVMKMMDSNDL